MQRVTEDLETTLQKLSRSKTFTIAHYTLSAQTFGEAWAALHLIVRFIVEPSLRRDPRYKDDVNRIALAEREKRRKEGLEMIERLAFHFHSPELFHHSESPAICRIPAWRR